MLRLMDQKRAFKRRSSVPAVPAEKLPEEAVDAAEAVATEDVAVARK